MEIFVFKDSSKRDVDVNVNVVDVNKDLDNVLDLDKDLDNVRWFLHQIYSEQERMKVEMKKEKRHLHKMAQQLKIKKVALHCNNFMGKRKYLSS